MVNYFLSKHEIKIAIEFKLELCIFNQGRV